MKLKLSYTSGVKPEIVDIGDQTPSEYIAARFGGGTLNELVKLGGSYAIVEEAPLKLIEEVTAPITAPYTVATAVDQAEVEEVVSKSVKKRKAAAVDG